MGLLPGSAMSFIRGMPLTTRTPGQKLPVRASEAAWQVAGGAKCSGCREDCGEAEKIDWFTRKQRPQCRSSTGMTNTRKGEARADIQEALRDLRQVVK